MVRRILVVVVLMAIAAVPVFANHAWGNYHWSTTSYPMTIKVGDNVSAAWDSYLNEAIADWNQSTRLALTKVTGGTNPKNCRPTAGRVEVCNSAYGYTGWLGIAQIWTSGGHISQGTCKMNDSYYSSATYNTPGWRDLVMCQEVGHDWGLGHQDENFDNTNLGTCMDYTNSPDGGGSNGNLSNRAPNAHDYSMLESIYSHTHASNSYSSMYDVLTDSIARGGSMPLLDGEYSEPWQWGNPTKWDSLGRPIRFERNIGADHGGHEQEDGDFILVTDVFWAPVDIEPIQVDTPSRSR